MKNKQKEKERKIGERKREQKGRKKENRIKTGSVKSQIGNLYNICLQKDTHHH